MKVLLDIRDDKVPFFMEMLKNFEFVKATSVAEEDISLEDEIQEAVENLKRVREGKLEARSARALLDEL